MTSLKVIITTLLIAGASLLNAAQPFEVSISLERNRFYYDDSVVLSVAVTNISGSPASFMVYDEIERPFSYTTFQPLVIDPLGRTVETRVPHKLEGNAKDNLLKNCSTRTIILNPGESFRYSTDLTKVFVLRPGVDYRVRTRFMPDFSLDDSLTSRNQVSFLIEREKHYVYKSGVVNRFQPKEYSRSISPSEIVVLTLRAEKEQDWKRLRKYIDVEKLIHSYTRFVREYRKADVVEKYYIRERFVRYLARKRFDYLLDFSVVGETMEDGKAHVTVYVERYGPRKSSRYIYRYTLAYADNNKGDNHWLITELDATVTKGKQK